MIPLKTLIMTHLCPWIAPVWNSTMELILPNPKMNSFTIEREIWCIEKVYHLISRNHKERPISVALYFNLLSPAGVPHVLIFYQDDLPLHPDHTGFVAQARTEVNYRNTAP